MIPISLEGPSVLCVKIKVLLSLSHMNPNVVYYHTILVIYENCTIKIRINCPPAFSFTTLKYAM